MDLRPCALLAALSAGCIHHTPPPKWSEAAKELCQRDVCYRVGDLGEGWQAVHKEAASIGFYSARAGGVIESNATCRDDAEASPLSALTRQLLIGYTDREVHEEKMVQLAEREALRTRLDAKLDGVPVALEVYVLRRNGCIFDLTYAAPPDRYDAGKPDFDRFVSGFVDLRKLK